MIQNQTSRLRLPLLASGQAQKEVAHNEALMLLDLVGQAVVESADLSAPPAAPIIGKCWIVGPLARDDWAGMAGMIAGWTSGGWRFSAPGAGWQIWVIDRAATMRFDETGWSPEAVRANGYYIAGARVLAARRAAIADPSGGTTSDDEARATIIAILDAMRAHGLIEL